MCHVTLNMHFKLTKISNLSSPDSFFSSSKCTKPAFGPRWGSLQRSLRPPSWLGRGRGMGIPLPIPLPLDAFGVSNLAPTVPRYSGPPYTISWLRHCLAEEHPAIYQRNLCIADSRGLSSFVLPLLPLKSAKSREIPSKFKRIAVQGHPRSSILLPIEAHMQVPISH